jgi:hypothetical protein
MTGDELETTGENSRSEVEVFSPVSSFSSPLRGQRTGLEEIRPCRKGPAATPCTASETPSVLPREPATPSLQSMPSSRTANGTAIGLIPIE